MQAAVATATPAGKNDAELVPTLNNYVRGKLSKNEVISFADCARALASAITSQDASSNSKELFGKILNRMALFGAMPPSILPVLVSVRVKVDMPKTADRKLLRVVNYLIQVAAGEGSAGTVMPFSTLIGNSLPVCATDTFEYDALDPLWSDCKAESATHYQRSAAFRTLAALARSSLTSDPDDLTLVSHLMAAVATCLDKCEAARRRKLPFFGSNKKSRELDRRQTLERVAAQRAALSAARTGLPGFVLSSKISPRAFTGVNSPDPLCARHAMAVAALAARDQPGMYAEQMSQLVANTLEIYSKTGSLGGAEQAAAMAAAAAEGLPAPLRPTKELYQEKSLNLMDAWARLYLARGCGAVVHSGVGNSAVFWQMLTLLACCDKSTVVALEAIKALAGASYPTASNSISTAGSGSLRRPPLLPDEHAEADVRLKFSMAWNLLVARADDDAPGVVPVAPTATQSAVNKQFTISRSQRAVEESPSLKRLATFGAGLIREGSSAGDGSSAISERPSQASSTLFAAVVQRLLACLSTMSHAAICSTIRAVGILAESRAHALASARTAADQAAVLGDVEVQDLMLQLEDRMHAIASDTGFSSHQREKAMEALLWFAPLPVAQQHPALLLTPHQIAKWMSSGGGTVPQTVRAIFADPWSDDVLASFMLTLARRLLSAPAAAPYLLGCAAAVASVAPSRIRQEQLQAMWDVCLRANSAPIKLAGLQAALGLLCAPTPAIACPPSAAAPEVKALASKEEAAMLALSRSAAWWLGENANFGAGEYAWQPRPLSPHLITQLEEADGCSQQQLAAAAVEANPMLSLLIARLQRVMMTGLWEVRIAAAQAIAKIAVRSGEPFRVQCYNILATAAGGSIAHLNRSNRGSSTAVTSKQGAASHTAAGQAAAAASAAAAESTAGDPLGIAAVVGPALEVLDHMYASELVVEQLLLRYGKKRSGWPKKLLKTLEKRNATLVAAISERVGFVPKELFWPLGNAARDVFTGKEDEEEAKKKKKEKEEAAAAAEAAAAEAAADGSEAVADKQEEQQVTRYRDSSEGNEQTAMERSKTMLEQLQGYDYDPSAQPADEDYPDDSVSQLEYGDDDYDHRPTGAHSDDDSDIVLRRGVVLFDFKPEEEDEVAVYKGESLDVDYEVGGWLQVIKRDGSRGLVPKSYVQVAEDDEDNSDAFSLAGRSNVSGSQTQAEGAADYNSFLQRSSMRLRTRTSIADSEASTPYASIRQQGFRLSRYSDADDGPDVGGAVDAAEMARQVALVAQQGGGLDRALEQVDQLEASSRYSVTFNQPQYLHLKESFSDVIDSLDKLQLTGDARTMRRQMRDRALTGLDRLELLRRNALSGPSQGGTPPVAITAPSLQRDSQLPAVNEAEPAAGGDDDYQYQPTKVRVLYAFDAEAEGELGVGVGESLWVESEVDGWYMVVRDGDGARGLVPTSYVEIEQL